MATSAQGYWHQALFESDDTDDDINGDAIANKGKIIDQYPFDSDIPDLVGPADFDRSISPRTVL